MSELLPSKARVRARFREAFGQPDTRLGRDDHWSLLPHPDALSINVLIEHETAALAVWVFDPHDHNDGVLRESILREEQIGELIELINSRLERGARGFTPKAY